MKRNYVYFLFTYLLTFVVKLYVLDILVGEHTVEVRHLFIGKFSF